MTITTTDIALASWLWVIATVLFLVAAILSITQRPDPTNGAFVSIGLALVVLGLLALR